MNSPKEKIIKRQPIAEYMQIRKYVVDTVWNSGTSPQRIASVRELAAMFNVSTMTIQRALKKLTDDGFLIARPGIGLFTNPDHRWKYGNINVIGVLVADGKQIYYEKYLWKLLSAVGEEITDSRKLIYQISFLSENDNPAESLAGIPMKGLLWLDPEFEPSEAAEEFIHSLPIPAVIINAFREAGVPLDTEEMLIPRGVEMIDHLNRLLDRIGTPEAIYAIGGTIRDIEATLQERRLDLDKFRLIGEPVIPEPYFRGWRIEHDFETLAKTACRQLFAEMDGAPRKNHDIPRKISDIR